LSESTALSAPVADARTRRRSIATRWLGVGLASALSVVTLALALTGRLALYISPSSNWFAITMAILLLVGAVASFALPLGAEEDHGHDHGTGHTDHDHRDHDDDHDDHDHHDRPHGSSRGALVASVAGGVIATGVVLSVMLVPPASLSADIAATRDVGSAPLFGGKDLVSLATHGDTATFGVGDWASVFATATNPDAFEGDAVTLTGFAMPASGGGGFDLTRLVITHCVIDAQVASVPITATGRAPAKGQWVTVKGTVRSAADGTLEIAANDVTSIAEPKDPYEY
jgi:uncharacterized repeat protein (TIGR03943 family)